MILTCSKCGNDVERCAKIKKPVCLTCKSKAAHRRYVRFRKSPAYREALSKKYEREKKRRETRREELQLGITQGQ